MTTFQISLSRAYKCIQKLDTVSLPDFAVLIGRNGVGKTQLLEALAGGAAVASGVSREGIEMYDFASFTPAKSAAVSWTAVQFATSVADAYFKALPTGKSPSALAADIYKQNTDSLASAPRKQFDDSLRHLVRQIPDFSTFREVENPSYLATYTTDIVRSVIQPIARRGGTRTQSRDAGCQDDPAILVSLAMKLANRAPHEITRADIMRASNYEGGTISNVISQVFAGYKVDAFLWAHREWETNGGEYDELIARYEQENKPPWDKLREIIDTMREAAREPSVFDFEFSDPANVKITMSDFATFQFQTEMTNRTTRASYDLDALSSGEKILMTLVLSTFNQLLGRRQPSLLLLDELDAMLHPSMVTALMAVMKDLFVSNGTKVIMTSHSPVTVAIVNEHEIFRVTRKGGRLQVSPATRTEAVHELSESLATIDTGLRILAFDQAAVTILTEGDNALHLKRWAKLNFPDDVRVFEGLSAHSGCSQLLTYGRFLARVRSNTHFLIVWDWDAADMCQKMQNELTPTSQVTAIALTQRDNAIAPKGIENKYEEDLLRAFSTLVCRSDGSSVQGLSKKRLRDHIYQNGTREDFGHFAELNEAVSSILASHQPRHDRATQGHSSAGVQGS